MRLELAPDALDTVVLDAKGLKTMKNASLKATAYAALASGVLLGIQNLLQGRQIDVDNVVLPLAAGIGAGSIVLLSTMPMRMNCRARIAAFLAHASPDESLAFDQALSEANLNSNDFR